ncbi:MAG TPA: PKD domain-containing protein, partial [Bacteroidia bacterium]|nr:PKD domain-containing protein [Bacteroidia bacterium]
ATDLYGICSQELASTTNAWYAVGVGAAATGSGIPTAAFLADKTMSCSAPLTVNFTNNTTGATTYNWSFGDGGTSTTATPAHTYTAAGVYAVQLVATGTCSSTSIDTLTKTSYITINGAPTVTSSTAACGPQSFVLTANGVGNITWSNSGGTVGTGSVFTTPTLSASTTYSATSSVMTVGTVTTTGAPALNTTLNAGGYLNYSHYLTFDATAAFTLHSVDIYAQTATSSQPIIQLLDNTGATLQSIAPTVNAAGVNTIALNWHVPIGTGYRLVAAGTNINLFRNNGGATFPIAVSTVASITGTDVTSTNPTYYYWFYNWKVMADAPCYSTAAVISPTITTCSATGIASNNAQSSSVSVYPNPAHNNISIIVLENSNSISVTDIIGQTVIAEQKINPAQQVQTIDIANLANGVYFMKINSTDNQVKVIRFIKE